MSASVDAGGAFWCTLPPRMLAAVLGPALASQRLCGRRLAIHRSPPLHSLPFGSGCQMCLWSDPDMKFAPCSESNALPDVRSAFLKAEFTHCLHSPSWGGLECRCLASTLDLGNQTLWGGAWDSAF